MTVSLKHSKVSTKSDGTDVTAVLPSDWNAEHSFTAAAGKVLGTAAGSTTVGELPIVVDSSLQAMTPPSGITSSRPATPSAGMFRMNTTTSRLEAYLNSSWTAVGRNAVVAASEPTNNYSGDFYFNTATNLLKIFNGSTFVDPQVGVADASITLAKLAAAVQQLLVPTGSVMPYAGGTAPTGWLLCDGSWVSTTTYSALFAVLGYTYGSSGATFALPDLRGRVPAGKDNMGSTGAANRLTAGGSGVTGTTLGASGGAENITLNSNQMPSHNHWIANGDNINAALGGNYLTRQSNPGTNNDYALSGSGTAPSIGLTSSAGGNQAHINVQPTLVLSYIIKI